MRRRFLLHVWFRNLAGGYEVCSHFCEYSNNLSLSLLDPAPSRSPAVTNALGYESPTLLAFRHIPRWCRVRDSNPRPSVYKTAALPLC